MNNCLLLKKKCRVKNFVSKKRSDLLLSTLSKYIAALGGTLKITAEFPNRPTVVIHQVSDLIAC